MNKFNVWYLGHSGYAVETKNTLLIFDYVENGDKLIGFGDAAMLNLRKYKDKKVYVFVSHEHDDHYDEAVFKWRNCMDTIEYILGWGQTRQKFTIAVPANMKLHIDDLAIHTIAATDEGVGFLVETDGRALLHMGDHANWHEDLATEYQQQIDRLAGKRVDVAFTPVAKGSGLRPRCILDGVVYMMEKLEPHIVFPMHAGSKEHLYKEFMYEIATEDAAYAGRIKCAENVGQKWDLLQEEA